MTENQPQFTDRAQPSPIRALAVIGPTASGKTALSLALAERLDAEIIVCDSMQVYRGMDIGTAKPTARERAVCPHHLVDCIDPTVSFSASDYADAAMAAVHDIHVRGKLPIFCGGTGLYLDAVRTGRHTAATPPPDPVLRADLQRQAQTPEGRLALYRRLADIDPDAAAATHPNNVHRVIRALEIYLSSGKTKTDLDREAPTENPALSLLIIEPVFRDREALYARIDARVDAMMAAGLVGETERLRDAGVFAKNATAAAAIGYKELLPYLEGICTLADAVEALKRATRRYAKRQLTYFRRMPGVLPVEADGKTPEAMAEALLPAVRAFLA